MTYLLYGCQIKLNGENYLDEAWFQKLEKTCKRLELDIHITPYEYSIIIEFDIVSIASWPKYYSQLSFPDESYLNKMHNEKYDELVKENEKCGELGLILYSPQENLKSYCIHHDFDEEEDKEDEI